MVNPHPPAACGARGIMCFRMFDTLLGAFAQVVPDRIPAANEGGSSAPHIALRTPDNRPFMASGGLMGCWGGRAGHDGQEGISNPAANLGNTPIELLQSTQPVEITHYGFVANSGGPGRWRGGAALMRGYKLLADEGVLIMRSDRRAITPYGLSNGLTGTPSWNVLNPGPAPRLLPVCPMESVALGQGDEFLHIQAGAGGFGDPLERNPQQVADDVINELITVDYARDVYGVVLDDGYAIDVTATVRERERLRQSGSHRTAYLRYFHQAVNIDLGGLTNALAARAMALVASMTSDAWQGQASIDVRP